MHSTHLDFRLLCSQIPLPPQSTHLDFRLLWGHFLTNLFVLAFAAFFGTVVTAFIFLLAFADFFGKGPD